ncbi:hypothetical protein AMECASPLE_022008, partial [Ameca splendens]
IHSRILEELHKEWTEAGAHRRILHMGYKCLTWAEENHNWTVAQRSKVLFSDESKFCLFMWRSRSKSLEEQRRGPESTLLEVQCEVATVSNGLGCHVICWFWSTGFS